MIIDYNKCEYCEKYFEKGKKAKRFCDRTCRDKFTYHGGKLDTLKQLQNCKPAGAINLQSIAESAWNRTESKERYEGIAYFRS